MSKSIKRTKCIFQLPARTPVSSRQPKRLGGILGACSSEAEDEGLIGNQIQLQILECEPFTFTAIRWSIYAFFLSTYHHFYSDEQMNARIN